MDDRSASVKIRLLGSVEVRVGDLELDVGSAKPRLVLAAMAASPGTVVPVEVLVDRVWGQDLPGRPVATLHPYLSSLRRALAPAGVELVRRSGGYVCETPADSVDVARFRDRLQAAKASGGGVAIEQLEGALALWCGQPLADLSGEWVSSFRAALGQERLAGWLRLAELRQQAGGVDAIADDLLALTADYPLSEPLAASVLRALALAGRRAEALDHYAGVRERLLEELGEEPGDQLSELHTALLRRAPGTPGARVSYGAGAPPRQLPAIVRPFVGREDRLSRLDELVDQTGAGGAVIATITGAGGIGKTALAVCWAHRMAGRFPDGQLYLDLRGFDPLGAPMSPGEALRGFLEALGVPPDGVPAGLQAQAALFRSLVSGRRLLLVLDNARDAEQVRPLLPAADGCVVLVTSRDAMTGLVVGCGAHPIGLDSLAVADARLLLEARLGADRLAAEPVAVAELLRPCHGLPLALAVVAARAAQHPAQPLAELVGQLVNARRRLDAFDTDDPRTALRAVFASSYDKLAPEARRTFRLLGLHPGPDISVTAAASLTGNADVCQPLRQLEAAHLIRWHQDRYSLHDLVRAYACDLAESDPERDAAGRRMLDHYLWSSSSSERLLVPHRTSPAPVPPPAQPGVRPDEPADLDEAMTWFGSEQAVLLQLVQQAATAGHDVEVVQLSATFGTFLRHRRLFDDWLTIAHVALAAASRLGDQAALSTCHRELGQAYARLGRYPEAAVQVRTGLEIARDSRDRTGEAVCHQAMASLQGRERNYAEARRHAQQACELHTYLGNAAGRGRALNQVGWFSAQLSDCHEAVSACESAVAVCDAIGDTRGTAAAWDSLGYAYRLRGDHRQAVRAYHHAVVAWRETRDRYFEGDTLTNLGDALRDSGEATVARRAWRQALETLSGLAGVAAEQARSALAERLSGEASR